MPSRTRFAIVRNVTRGRNNYQARDVGCVTRLPSQMWTTTDRAAADRLCDEVGGKVVEIVSAAHVNLLSREVGR